MGKSKQYPGKTKSTHNTWAKCYNSVFCPGKSRSDQSYLSKNVTSINFNFLQ